VDLEPIPDIPALLMKSQRSWIIVADLHIGIEAQLRRAGFNIPSQTEKMFKTLEGLSSMADGLIVLGDVKHKIPGVSYREDREIPPFIDRLLSSYRELIVVAGNHDGGLGAILSEDVRAIPGNGTAIDEVGICHGHVWPSKSAMAAQRLVMGHIHPSVLLTDSIGSRTNEKCWAKARFEKKLVLERYEHCPEELVVVPAFNPLLTGTPVNGRRGAYLGPIFRNRLVDQKSMEVYLLDGSNLGHMPSPSVDRIASH